MAITVDFESTIPGSIPGGSFPGLSSLEEQWIVVVHKIKPPRVSRSNRFGRMSRVTQSEECQTVNLEVLGSKPSARDQSTFTRVRVPGVKVVIYLQKGLDDIFH